MINITKYKVELVKESGKRYNIEKTISSPEDCKNAFNEIFNLENQAEEALVMLALDTKNSIIGAFEVSRGSVNASIVHPREVFKRLLVVNATRFVIAHNHPSGSPAPSQDDLNITKRLKNASEILGIEMLDHIIIGENNHRSFKADGLL